MVAESVEPYTGLLGLCPLNSRCRSEETQVVGAIGALHEEREQKFSYPKFTRRLQQLLQAHRILQQPFWHSLGLSILLAHVSESILITSETGLL